MLKTNEITDTRAFKAGDEVVSCITLASTILGDLEQNNIIAPYDQSERNQRTLEIARMLLESVLARREELGAR